ncbi:hypothetical protein P152DRAFT_16569 [Eremomyces bilateralis CBS 781.70]|uniref:PH domain-containing protein n=1 Tax=Eremomyces bilateralis CBS 781.70 TaxID=1392243 RepID=A0A6G1GHL5_9PEZI|nr:uncharacterized protein P152DRAFT_16569 [Eremomyces bilateralis CBS 781.70]KAF1817360.1 hypothetical protein P152DRAFT_16569 [Eremomyces bilateralis CBS 781.70]
MSTEATKPTVVADAPAAVVEVTKPEETTTPAAPVVEDKPAETAAEPAAEPAATAVEEAKPVEKKEKPAVKPIEPITEGSLKYKAPGLHISHFVPQKKYFWLGTEEAVSTQSLASYLRGEEPKISQPTAAWASQTGKGLLFFSKTAELKATPAHVFNLAEITDLEKSGIQDLSFKLDGEKKAEKHVLEAINSRERDGWLLALKAASEDAKAKKEEILNSEGYKASIAELGKPNTVAAVAPATAATTKDKAESKPAETKVEAETTTPAPAAEKKSRSISRGKRGSVFGFLSKKEEEAKKAEEKKTETKEEETPATEAAAAVEPAVDAPATTEATEAPKEEAKEEAATPATETSKPAKRASIFGGLQERVQKLRSPSHEKKESEVVPAAKAEETKAEETAAAATEPATETPATETPAVVAPATEEPVKEADKPAAATATAPATDRKPSFISGIFKHKSEKSKSPTTETAPVLPAPAATEETPKPAEEAAPAVPAKDEPTKVEEPVNGTSPTTETAAPVAPTKSEKRRSSFFGSLGGSVKKIGEKKPAEVKPVEAAKPAETETPAATETVEADKPAEAVAETATPVVAATETPAAEETKSAEKKEEKTTKSHVSKGLSGLSRNFSKIIKGGKDKAAKPTSSTEKGEASKLAEEAKPADEKAVATEETAKPAEETKPETTTPEVTKEEKPAAIGDVTAESVTVSDPPPAGKTVQATA